MRVQDAIRDSFRVDYYRCVGGWGAWQQQVRQLGTAAAMLQHQCAADTETPAWQLARLARQRLVGGPVAVARAAPDAWSACMCCPVCVCVQGLPGQPVQGHLRGGQGEHVFDPVAPQRALDPRRMPQRCGCCADAMEQQHNN